MYPYSCCYCPATDSIVFDRECGYVCSACASVVDTNLIDNDIADNMGHAEHYEWNFYDYNANFKGHTNIAVDVYGVHHHLPITTSIPVAVPNGSIKNIHTSAAITVDNDHKSLDALLQNMQLEDTFVANDSHVLFDRVRSVKTVRGSDRLRQLLVSCVYLACKNSGQEGVRRELEVVAKASGAEYKACLDMVKDVETVLDEHKKKTEDTIIRPFSSITNTATARQPAVPSSSTVASSCIAGVSLLALEPSPAPAPAPKPTTGNARAAARVTPLDTIGRLVSTVREAEPVRWDDETTQKVKGEARKLHDEWSKPGQKVMRGSQTVSVCAGVIVRLATMNCGITIANLKSLGVSIPCLEQWTKNLAPLLLNEVGKGVMEATKPGKKKRSAARTDARQSKSSMKR